MDGHKSAPLGRRVATFMSNSYQLARNSAPQAIGRGRTEGARISLSQVCSVLSGFILAFHGFEGPKENTHPFGPLAWGSNFWCDPFSSGVTCSAATCPSAAATWCRLPRWLTDCPDPTWPCDKTRNHRSIVVVGKHFTFFLWWFSGKSPLNC